MGKLALRRNEIFITLTRTINDRRYEVMFLGHDMNEKIIQKPLGNNLKRHLCRCTLRLHHRAIEKSSKKGIKILRET